MIIVVINIYTVISLNLLGAAKLRSFPIQVASTDTGVPGAAAGASSWDILWMIQNWGEKKHGINWIQLVACSQFVSRYKMPIRLGYYMVWLSAVLWYPLVILPSELENHHV